MFVFQDPDLVSPLGEIHDQRAWLITATAASDPLGLLDVLLDVHVVKGTVGSPASFRTSTTVFAHSSYDSFVVSGMPRNFRLFFLSTTSKRSTSSFKYSERILKRLEAGSLPQRRENT